MTERRQEGLYQAIAQVDAKHDAGHKRLRDDFRELEERMSDAMSLMRDRQIENTAKISKLADTPPNVENVIMTPRVMIGIVLFAVTMAGSIWSSTYGLRSDVRDIITRMEAQKTAYDSAAKLQEVQSTGLKSAIDDMKRRQELQQYEIQALKEVILTGKGKTK